MAGFGELPFAVARLCSRRGSAAGARLVASSAAGLASAPAVAHGIIAPANSAAERLRARVAEKQGILVEGLVQKASVPAPRSPSGARLRWGRGPLGDVAR